MDPQNIELTAPSGPLKGTINLPTSKSIANRYLILSALSEGKLTINHLSESDDTQILHQLLTNPPGDGVYDAHHAGTTSRFLLAYLALQPGTQVITGSDRLKTRPIKALADALTSMGANLTYLEKEGCQPIQVDSPSDNLATEVTLSGGVSSQFITALLLNAASLPKGLTIHIDGEWISRPYIEMTLRILEDVGIQHTLTDTSITIQPQAIAETTLSVESDWSAASYFIALVCARPGSEVILPRLFQDSIQGDSGILPLIGAYGCEYAFGEEGLRVRNTQSADTDYPPMLEMNLEDTPDIFQTLATLHSILGISCMYSGLSTLPGKETNRITAMQAELQKGMTFLSKLPSRFTTKYEDDYYLQEGKASLTETPTYHTYQDHRMAMSLALMSLIHPVKIEDPSVVTKSFPTYWDQLKTLGFEVREVS